MFIGNEVYRLYRVHAKSLTDGSNNKDMSLAKDAPALIDKEGLLRLLICLQIFMGPTA
jgi:hypothetical protein